MVLKKNISLFALFLFLGIGQSIYSSESSNERYKCQKRYSLLKKYLNKFKRPFTMITLGSEWNGYSSFKAANIYHDSVFVVTENQSLLFLCQQQLLHNLILLTESLNKNNLKILSQCEDFDIIFVPDLIKTFQKESKAVLNEIINLGFLIFITIPKKKKLQNDDQYKLIDEIEAYLLELSAIKLECNDPNYEENFYLLERSKNYLLRKTWDRGLHSEKSHRIESNYVEKKLIKNNKNLKGITIESEWKPGINLITFKMLQGVFPIKEKIIENLYSLRTILHNDWVINNMIIQGNKLSLIDFDDPRRGPRVYCSDHLFEKNLQIIYLDDKEEIIKRLIQGLK